MLLHIPAVLDAQAVQAMREQLAQAPWTDGLATVGALGATVKRNRQVPGDSPQGRALAQAVEQAVRQQPLFISAALPRISTAFASSRPIHTPVVMPLEKPRNQPSLLLDVVPVLPATGRPICAALPVPVATAVWSRSVIPAATQLSTSTCPFVAGR